MMIEILLGVLIVVIVAGVFVLYKKDGGTESAQIKADLNQKEREIGELTGRLKEESEQKNELAGKNKQLFVEKENLKADNRNLHEKNSELKHQITKFEETEQRRAKEQEQNIGNLKSAQEALEDEKKRIRREDEERQTREVQERDRIWNEHEGKVINALQELCVQPEYAFKTFDNNNLPEGFSGKLKPDFMIEFLGRYVIFDAKMTKSNDVNTYIKNQVKKTAEKVEKNSQIYPTVFLVVPTLALPELKQVYFYEKGIQFFVISEEALAPILSSLKKITTYEFAEQIDPQDQDAIVKLIAEFDYHINFRNAFDILLAQRGAEILKNRQKLNGEMQNEVEQKKKEMRLANFTPTELKNLILNPSTQGAEIEDLVQPKASIQKEDIKKAQLFLDEK